MNFSLIIIQVYMTLYNRGVNACGTKATVQNRGYYDFRSNGPLLAAVWVDKWSIYFLFIMHISEASGVTFKRKKLDGPQDNIPCSPLLPD